jgi:hypothetical protein
MNLEKFIAEIKRETAEEFLQFIYDSISSKCFIRQAEKFAKGFGVKIEEDVVEYYIEEEGEKVV